MLIDNVKDIIDIDGMTNVKLIDGTLIRLPKYPHKINILDMEDPPNEPVIMIEVLFYAA